MINDLIEKWLSWYNTLPRWLRWTLQKGIKPVWIILLVPIGLVLYMFAVPLMGLCVIGDMVYGSWREFE